MFLVKRIIVMMCAKNYKSKFTFVKVIHEKVQTLFFWTRCSFLFIYWCQKYYYLNIK